MKNGEFGKGFFKPARLGCIPVGHPGSSSAEFIHDLLQRRSFNRLAPTIPTLCQSLNPKSEVKKGIVWRRALWYKGCVE
jgi:hypothetical protein